MHPIEKAVPSIDVLLALQPEELAPKILALMKTDPGGMAMSGGKFNVHNFALTFRTSMYGLSYGDPKLEEASLACREAVGWLQANCLLVADDSNWSVLSRRARDFRGESEIDTFIQERRFPKELLHPSIPERVWLSFIRGEYDTAVFQAMKAVEVALRDASKPSKDEVGVALARFAFHPSNGPLTDQTAEAGEKEAMSALFAGAFGVLKNPQSHRDVNLDDPRDASAIIMFAGYLLNVIASRAG